MGTNDSPARMPKWKEFPQYPVISGIALLAIVVTVAWWGKADISPLFQTAEIRRGQLWRLFTSVLPHIDILHLAFNLYWLWILGTVVERVYGHSRTLLLLCLFAFGSNCFDFAFDRGGVGLSGVGYGLFGLLYVLSARDERFRGTLNRQTINLFIGWFFFCILATVTNTFRVANVAHGAGAALGLLAGFAIVLPNRRTFIIAGLTFVLILGLWGATLGRPKINLSGHAGFDEATWGYDALQAKQTDQAIRWLRDATKLQPKCAECWFDLGIAYHRAAQMPAARNAYERVYELDPTDADYSAAAGKTEKSKESSDPE